MSGDSRRTSALALDIVDDRPVDWAAASSSVNTERDRRIVEQLAQLSRIREWHRGADGAHVGVQLRDEQYVFDTCEMRATLDGSTLSYPSGTWHQLTILDRLGGGSCGEVFRAFDAHLNREVALKLLRPRPQVSDEAAVHEARLLARLGHPNVVTIHGAAVDQGFPGFWMELVRGRTLSERLRAEGPLPAGELRRIGAVLADAAAAVHRAGLLHRDIKAENVMETEDGRIVLMDFSAGQVDACATQAKTLAGTPLYLAPELLAGGSASIGSDIYSIGALLYLLATGRHPVRGRSLQELEAAHARRATGQDTDFRSALRVLPRRLRGTIIRALAHDVRDRFVSAETLAGELRSERRLGAQTIGGASAALAVVVLALVVAFRRPPIALPPAGTGARSERLPSLDIGATFFLPRLSRDGTKIVFSHGPDQLQIADTKSGRTQRILVPAAPDGQGQYAYDAVMSRDGRVVAYTSYSTEVPLARLQLADVETGTSRTLIDEATVSFIQALDWAADGESLLIQMGRSGHRPALFIFNVKSGRLQRIVDLAGSVTAGSFSPDGRHVVMDEANGEGVPRLVRLEVATGLRSELPAWSTYNTSPSWLEDNRVVFIGNTDGRAGVWSLPMAAGAPAGTASLVADNLGAVLPWGFDATGALVYSPRTGPSRVMYAPFDGSTRKGQIATQGQIDGTLETWSPAWSPDGESLAYFQATGLLRPEVTLRIRKLSSSSTETRSIRSGRGFMLRWSGDGRRLAWLTSENGSRSITVLDLAHGTVDTWFRWLSPPPNFPLLSFAWMGNNALAVADSDRVFVVGESSEGPQPPLFIAPPGARLVQGLVGDFDGRSVTFAVESSHSGRVSLLRVSARSRELHELWRTDHDHFCELFSRSPDGRFFFVSAAPPRQTADIDPSALTVWDSATGQQRTVATGPMFADVVLDQHTNRLAWTSGRFIAMSQPVRLVPARSVPARP